MRLPDSTNVCVDRDTACTGTMIGYNATATDVCDADGVQTTARLVGRR